MRKLTKWMTFAFVATLAFSFTLAAAPQSAEAGWYTWKRYRLKFWLPRGVKPTTRTRWTFIAKGKGLVIKIKPWISRRGTSASAAMYGYKTYHVIKRKRIISKKRLRAKNGTWRYAIIGKGYVGYKGRRRSSVRFAVLGMANHKKKTRFYVRFWWKKWRNLWVTPRVNKIAKRIYTY